MTYEIVIKNTENALSMLSVEAENAKDARAKVQLDEGEAIYTIKPVKERKERKHVSCDVTIAAMVRGDDNKFTIIRKDLTVDGVSGRGKSPEHNLRVYIKKQYPALDAEGFATYEFESITTPDVENSVETVESADMQ